MTKNILYLSALALLMIFSFSRASNRSVQADEGPKTGVMKKELTDLERFVIQNKGTEAPFTGEYCDFKGEGTYHCKQCGEPLYESKDKFSS